jgi:hypothetical protein
MAKASMMPKFFDWNILTNPILHYTDWSIKDACCAWREGVFTLFFSAFDEQRSTITSVSTRDFIHFSDFLFCFDGRAEGTIGMCSPDIVQVTEGYVLTFNAWGDKPGSPNQLFYMQSTDLVNWSDRFPLASSLTAGVRAIDAALAFSGDVWTLIYKKEQSRRPVIAAAPSIDGLWQLVGDQGAQFFMADGRESELSHENFQFIEIDGRWRLICTDYAPDGGVSHHPHLYSISGTGEAPEDWLRWENGYRLEIPAESFNTISRDNAAALCDWREQGGYFYLVYAGHNEERQQGFRGLASGRPWPRGWNKLGLARSRDLVQWHVPGMMGS